PGAGTGVLGPRAARARRGGRRHAFRCTVAAAAPAAGRLDDRLPMGRPGRRRPADAAPHRRRARAGESEAGVRPVALSDAPDERAGWSAWPAPAKLNLFLRIPRRRPDGYHELQTVFRLLGWGDTVYLR